MKKLIFIFLTFLISFQLHASYTTAILLKANDSTSFMYYELHGLAYEAASQKQYEDSIRIYKKIAKDGDDRAQYNVGMMYLNGLGIKASKKDAYKWLRKAAKQNNVRAKLFFENIEIENRAKLKKSKQKAEAKRLRLKKKKEEANKQQKEKEALAAFKAEQEAAKSVEQAKIAQPEKMKTNQNPKKEESGSIAIYITLFMILIVVAFVYIKRKKSVKKEEKTVNITNTSKYKTFDALLEKIETYHEELLKHIDLSTCRNDKKKMQVYYMFLTGAIDSICQEENFSESEHRRMFNTFITKVEGKENLTAVTQSVLEGQKNHSLYHAQAAGGISAKQWYADKSKGSVLMLKKVLDEYRA